MRTITGSRFALFLFPFFFQAPELGCATSHPDNAVPSVEIVSFEGFHSVRELEVIAEINLMRRDPAGYGHRFLEPLRACYQGSLLCYPGSVPIRTSEGVAALDECIRQLEGTGPLPGLSPSRGLFLAARDHVHDQGPAGTIGHAGRDGSSPTSRIERYGLWELSAGENISYGYGEARKIVAALLIDDGVPTRGHRQNLLNGRFRVVGVGVGPHRSFGHMCVMDFAGGFRLR